MFSGKKLAYGLIGLGICCFAAAFVVQTNTPRPPVAQTSPAQPGVSAVKASQSEIDNYTVAADLPKYISIPAINIGRARIKALGTTGKNQIAVPSSIYDAGWYNTSAKPGQPGATFVYGHLSDWNNHGVFYDLKKLKTGDEIIITKGDDRQFTYKVVATKTYPNDKVDMNAVLSPVQSKVRGLNLMTCAGQVIKGTNDFTDRLVVYTSLVKS